MAPNMPLLIIVALVISLPHTVGELDKSWPVAAMEVLELLSLGPFGANHVIWCDLKLTSDSQ
jgi:hypothetical protein